MDSDQIANLLYLSLLGSVIAFWFFIQNRKSMNKTLQQAAVWVLIFIGVVAGFGLWGDIRQSATLRHSISDETGEISVPRAPDGHYYLTLQVNDQPVRFVIDTGATDMVLSKADATSIGINVDNAPFYRQAQTANGVVRVAPVTLDRVEIGPIVDRDVRASVNEGDMDGSLLGMSYLQRFDRIEIAGGQMVLSR